MRKKRCDNCKKLYSRLYLPSEQYWDWEWIDFLSLCEDCLCELRNDYYDWKYGKGYGVGKSLSRRVDNKTEGR